MNTFRKLYRTWKYKKYFRIITEQVKDPMDRDREKVVRHTVRQYNGPISYFLRRYNFKDDRPFINIESAYEYILKRKKENDELIDVYKVMSDKEIAHNTTAYLLKKSAKNDNQNDSADSSSPGGW